MILVIPQLLLTTLAVLCLNRIISDPDKKALQKKLIRGAIATGSVFLFAFICYFSFDYLSESNHAMLKQVKQMNQPQLTQYVKEFTNGLVTDRKSLFLTDIFRTLGFIILAAGLIYASLKKWIQPIVVGLGIALFAFIDVAMVNNKYLNEENYLAKEDKANEFVETAKDREILADQSNYRVFNKSGDRFAETASSYLYKSLGGYHSAKLRIYQDLYERQLSNEPNPAVLNMLNAKYLIQKDQQEKTISYEKNNAALGSAWFVQSIRFVKDADAEMAALDQFNPKDTAIVQESFKPMLTATIEPDTTGAIRLVKNDNDIVSYEATSSKNGFVVFSEIYYPAGWKAFVDGKEQPIIKTNYVLRGLMLTPGSHKIEFRFAPEGHLKGVKYARMANILLGLALLSLFGYLYFSYKKNSKPTP
jgi:hypothetical protein